MKTDELSKHFRAKQAVEDDSDENEKSEDEGVGSGKSETNLGEDSDLEEDERKIEEMENDLENEDSDEESEEEENTEPKILITTHDMRIHIKTYKLCRELCRVLPNAQYFYRKNTRLTKIIPEAIKRNYSAMIVINEDRKEPSKYLDGYSINLRCSKSAKRI